MGKKNVEIGFVTHLQLGQTLRRGDAPSRAASSSPTASSRPAEPDELQLTDEQVEAMWAAIPDALHAAARKPAK